MKSLRLIFAHIFSQLAMAHLAFLPLLHSENTQAQAITTAVSCDYAGDPDMQQKKAACSSQSGKSWDCRVNRCLSTAEAKAVNHKFEQCLQKPTDEEKKQCHLDLAVEEHFNETGDDLTADKNKKGLNLAYKGVLALSIFHIVVSAVVAKKGKQAAFQCLSMKIYTAAAIAGVAAELYHHFFLKKKSKKIKEEYDKKQIAENGLTAQSDAFEFLAKEQDEVAKTAKMKKLTYYLVAALYGATSVVALFEATKGADACASKKSNGAAPAPAAGQPAPGGVSAPPAGANYSPFMHSKDIAAFQYALAQSNNSYDAYTIYSEWQRMLEGENSSITLTDYENRKKYDIFKDVELETSTFKEVFSMAIEMTNQVSEIIFSSAHAQPAMDTSGIATTANPGGAGEVMQTESMINQGATQNEGKVNNFLSSPILRAIIAGIGAIVAFRLGKASGDVEKQAKERAKSLRETATKFMGKISGFCHDRTDRRNLKCYCYTESGQRDQEKAKYQSCNDYFKRLDQTKVADATTYKDDGTTPITGCVNQQGAFDPQCKCKNEKGSSGDNSCYKTRGFGGLTGSPFGQAVDSNQLSKLLDSATSGNLTTGNLSSQKVGAQAAKFKGDADKLFDKVNKDLAASGQKPIAINDIGEKLFNSIQPTKQLRNFASGSLGGGSQVLASLSPNSEAAKLFDQAASASGIKDDLSFGGGDLSNKKGQSPNYSIPDLGPDQAGVNELQAQVQDVMNKDFEYGDVDVNQDEMGSIFEIISNRYVVTGLKRLFTEEEEKINEQ